MNLREVLTLAPLVVACVWIGVYPKPFFEMTAPASAKIVAAVEKARGAGAAASRRPRPAPSRPAGIVRRASSRRRRQGELNRGLPVPALGPPGHPARARPDGARARDPPLGDGGRAGEGEGRSPGRRSRRSRSTAALIPVAVSFAGALPRSAYGGMVALDGFGIFFKVADAPRGRRDDPLLAPVRRDVALPGRRVLRPPPLHDGRHALHGVGDAPRRRSTSPSS